MANQEHIEKRVSNRASREKSGLSSQSKPTVSSAVIYKVSFDSKPISEGFFAKRPDFCRGPAPSESTKKIREPGSAEESQEVGIFFVKSD